jgi:hypothetical protein
MHGISIRQCFWGEALSMGAREPGCEETRNDDQGRLSWDWPIMPGKLMQGRPEGAAKPCLGGVGAEDNRRFLPCSIAQMAANTTTHQIILQKEAGQPATGVTAKAKTPQNPCCTRVQTT